MRLGIILMGMCIAVGCADSTEDDAGFSGAGMCGAFEACGGDPVGTWDVESMCLEDIAGIAFGAIDEPACKDFLRGFDIRPMGSLELGADGFATEQVTLQMDLDVTVTAACIAALGGGSATSAQCQALEREFAMQPTLAGGGCELRSGGCDCVVTSEVMELMSASAYEVRGQQLVAGGSASDFCVQEDRLTLRAVTPMGAGQLSYIRR